MKLGLSYLLILVYLITGCKKDQFESYDRTIDSDYFNDSIGASTIYKVEEIIYDDFTNSSDTFEYQLKELNHSVFRDNMNRDAIKIDRYTRISDSSKWKYINSWYAVKSNNMVERIEDNKRFIKLSFPVTIDAVWNSNAYNLDNAVNVFYGIINQRYTLDTFKFKNALSVESSNINNIFRERSFREVYVRGIGLVYKNHISIEKNGTVYRGFKINYRLIKHEK
ncbi:MAG: hypothetical protein IT245_03240 [Bacteroidia bacterium]|nr:hypothetical protein [Bacteroidia bacterium]